MARQRIPDAVRRKVAEDCESGISKKKVADKHGISVTSVTRILKEQEEGDPPAEAAREELGSSEMQKKLSEVERRIRDLEQKILYFEARKHGKGTRA